MRPTSSGIDRFLPKPRERVHHDHVWTSIGIQCINLPVRVSSVGGWYQFTLYRNSTIC